MSVCRWDGVADGGPASTRYWVTFCAYRSRIGEGIDWLALATMRVAAISRFHLENSTSTFNRSRRASLCGFVIVWPYPLNIIAPGLLKLYDNYKKTISISIHLVRKSEVYYQ